MGRDISQGNLFGRKMKRLCIATIFLGPNFNKGLAFGVGVPLDSQENS